MQSDSASHISNLDLRVHIASFPGSPWGSCPVKCPDLDCEVLPIHVQLTADHCQGNAQCLTAAIPPVNAELGHAEVSRQGLVHAPQGLTATHSSSAHSD